MPDTDFGRAQLSLILHRHRESQRLSRSVESGRLPPSISAEKTSKAMLKAVQHIDIKEIMYQLPDDTYMPFREMVKASLPSQTIDETTYFQGYTVGEYHQFWIEFTTLMGIYLMACEKKEIIDKSFNSLGNRVLQFSLPTIVILVTNRGNVGKETTKHILSDLILDLKASHPDVLVQPLIPFPSKQIILLSPSLITTTNWEVCLLRNWSSYPDVYGRVIGAKKDRLSDQFSRIFNSQRFVVSTRKKLYSGSGQLVGDVDVAVFDPSEGLLVLFEVKWLIEPDSPRETIKAHMELETGIKQVLRNKSEFTRDPTNFLTQVFPDRTVEVTAIKDLKCFVAARGSVGHKDDWQNQVLILDYSLSSDIIASSGNSSLRQMIEAVIDQQRILSDFAAKRAGIMRMKLAGYLFCLPGYGNFIEKPPVHRRRKEVERNNPCLCGSGLKYKKCCLGLEKYSENAMY
ncbi:YecA family protein [Chloroflexota bacterium]